MNDIAKTIVSVSNKQRNRNEREKEKIMSKEKPVIGTEGIYDARTLGAPRMLVLGIQHMFAMFGATVLVPVLTGLSVTTTLLFAGLGTLLFHLLAKGKVLDKFAGLDKDVTEVVGFANIIDAYDYLGDKEITVQTMFGINYVENFMGYRTLFLLPEKYIASKKVIALPVENIDLYYVDPSDSDFAKLGLNYTVKGETNLIGVHVDGDYSRATGDMYAIMGMKLWAEYLDGIAVATVSVAGAG